MAGLYLNSYGLTLDGDVGLFRMADAGSSYRRHELRALAGVSVWLDHNDAFAYERPAADAPAAEVVTRPLTPPDTVSLWAAREALSCWHGCEAHALRSLLRAERRIHIQQLSRCEHPTSRLEPQQRMKSESVHRLALHRGHELVKRLTIILNVARLSQQADHAPSPQ